MNANVRRQRGASLTSAMDMWPTQWASVKRDPFEDFADRAEPFQDEWLGWDVRLAAIPKTQDNEAAAIVAFRVTPIQDEAELEAEPVPEAPGMVFRREILPAHGLTDLLGDLKAGRVKVGDETFRLPDPDNGSPNFHFYMNPGYRGIHSTTFVLKADYNLNGVQTDLNELDRALRNADPPWDGFEDALEHFLQIHEAVYDALQRVHVEVAMNIGVELFSHEINGRELTLRFFAPASTHVERLTLGFVAFTKHSEIKRWRQPRSDVEVKRDDLGFTAGIRLPDDVIRARILASYRGHAAGTAHVTVAEGAPEMNPVRALEVLLGKDDLLADLLPQTDRQDEALERWAVVAFHCLGFQAVHIGASKSETADVVVHSPEDGSTILIECTMRTPDNKGKLAKLHHRRRQLEDALGHEVMAVLITFMKRDDVSQANRMAAHEDDISLLVREDLEQMAQWIYEIPTIAQVKTFLQRCIPSKSSSTQQLRRKRRHLE